MLGSRFAWSFDIVVFSSIATSFCVVLCRCSIFPTLLALRAKDRRKLSCVSEMFALKLANLTKIILKTLRTGFRTNRGTAVLTTLKKVFLRSLCGFTEEIQPGFLCLISVRCTRALRATQTKIYRSFAVLCSAILLLNGTKICCCLIWVCRVQLPILPNIPMTPHFWDLTYWSWKIVKIVKGKKHDFHFFHFC